MNSTENGTKELRNLQTLAKDLILSVAGQANILTIPRVFVDYMSGSLGGGLLLSQIMYWCGKIPEGEWFYKSYEDWKDEICLSTYEVRKYVEIMVKQGFLETKVMRSPKGDPTMHYKFDFEAFQKSFMKFLKNEDQNFEEGEPKIEGTYKDRHRLQTEITDRKKEKKDAELIADKRRSSSANVIHPSGDGFFGNGKTNPPKEPSKFQRATERLIVALHAKGRIDSKVDKYKWTKQLKEFSMKKDILPDELFKVLDWYTENMDLHAQYKVFNAWEFCNKFRKIRERMLDELKPKTVKVNRELFEAGEIVRRKIRQQEEEKANGKK